MAARRWIQKPTGDARDHGVPNLSGPGRTTLLWITSRQLGVEDLFYHVLTALHDPAYRAVKRRTHLSDGMAPHLATRLARRGCGQEHRDELAQSLRRARSGTGPTA